MKHYLTLLFTLFSVYLYSQPNSIDNSFNIGNGFATDNYVDKILVLDNNKILVKGNFTSFNSSTVSSNILVLNPSGSLSYSISSDLTSFNKFIQQPDGKLIICGSGTNPVRRYQGNNFNTIDNTFNYSSNLPIFDSELQTDGKLLILQKSVSTSVTRSLRRLNSNGTIDTSFPLINEIKGFRLLSDGKILAIHQNNLKRFNSNGTIDYSFNFNPINVYDIVKMEIFDNKLYLIADTGSYGSNGTIYRFLLDGNLESIILNLTNEKIKSIAFFNDGNILVGCNNNNSGGYNGLILLNNSGVIDTSFSTNSSYPLTNTLSTVYDVKIQDDNKIIVGGNFSNFNFSTKRALVRLNGFPNLNTNSFDDNKIILFPNPVNETINISKTANFDFEIYDLLGKIVLKGKSIDSAIKVNTLTKGIYILKLKNEEKTYNQKFIKE